MNKLITSIILLAGCLAGTLKFKVSSYNDCAEKLKFHFKGIYRTGDDIALASPTTLVVSSGKDSDGIPGRYVATNVASRIIADSWRRLRKQKQPKKPSPNSQKMGLSHFLENFEALIKEGMKNHLEEVARCKNGEMTEDFLKTGPELQPNKPSPTVALTVTNILNTELGDRLQIFQRGGSHVLVLRPTRSSEPGRFYYTPVFFSQAAFTDPNSPRLYAASAGLKPFLADLKNEQGITEVLEIPSQENDIVVVGSEVLFGRLPLPLITFIINSHLATITSQPTRTQSQPGFPSFSKNFFRLKYQQMFSQLVEVLQRIEAILPRNLVERAQKNEISDTAFGEVGLSPSDAKWLDRGSSLDSPADPIISGRVSENKPTSFTLERNPSVISPLSTNSVSQDPQPIFSEDLAQEEAQLDPEEIDSDFLKYNFDRLTERDLKNWRSQSRDLPPVGHFDLEPLQEIEILPDHHREDGSDPFKEKNDFFPFSNDSGNHWFSGPRKLLVENPLGHQKELPARHSGSRQRLLMRESNPDNRLSKQEAFIEDCLREPNEMKVEKPDLWPPRETSKAELLQFNRAKSEINAWANSFFEIPLEELLNLSCYADSASCAPIEGRPGLISRVAANALSNIFNFSEDVLPTIRKNLSAEQLSEELVAAGVQIFELKTPFYSPEFVRRFLANKPTNDLFSPETGFAVTAAVVVSDPVVFSPAELEKIIDGSRLLKNHCYRFFERVNKRDKPVKNSEKSDPVFSQLLAEPKMKKISKPTLDRQGRIEKQAALRRKSESENSDHQII